MKFDNYYDPLDQHPRATEPKPSPNWGMLLALSFCLAFWTGVFWIASLLVA